ncbi:spore germination protein [Thermosediminibacter litoriperuensis]|uniref:Spore germination protein n=1 Tax=Thermosediminibacter litoriperuensis TaxID=291989 RepID=A0A5S5AG44_9FIRM|nr:spore germination protein [Thermosediminibacter litoriperuensis]TYP49232.1 spore germination protein [Thermosediminibacter litoriperuensis]
MGKIFDTLFHRRKTEIFYERDMAPDRSRKLYKDIDENIRIFNEYLADCDDLISREFVVGNPGGPKHRMALFNIDGLVDKRLVHEEIMKSLMLFARQVPLEYSVGDKFFQLVKDGLLTVAEVREIDNFGEAVLAVLSGDTALFIDKLDRGLILNTRGWEKRSVQEPATEAVIRGPREGFTETYRVNVALVRRRIKDPNLKVQTIRLGRHTRTDVGVLYIKGIANPSIVEEVLKRLNSIDTSGVLESGYIEQMIEDNWLSFFPQFRRTERPDVAAASLMEGNVLIICDNTPFALIAPTTFYSLFQSPEDYYERWYIASLIRILRMTAAFLAATAPALYVAMISFHPGMLPTDLALSIGATREGVPFTTTVEALIMMLALEVLREAGIRLPGPIGQTIGIVGGLVVGEAAVRAGIVSPIMVILIAINAISSFAIPNFSLAVAFRLLAFIFLFLASVAGLYGLILGYLGLTIHLVTLKSFGSNYLSPLVSFKMKKAWDIFVRPPLPSIKERPDYTKPLDRERMRDLRQDQEGRGGDENADGRR